MGSDVQFWKTVCFNLDAIMAGNLEEQCTYQKHLLMMERKLDDLLQQLDMTKCINNELLAAYCASHEENTLLKAAMEALI
jgi:hypothetical protein